MNAPADNGWSLAVHGGAGRGRPTAGEAGEHEAMTAALEAGAAVLSGGGNSLDAVEAAVRVLEDAPVFNAGRGAAFNAAGAITLDAAIMDGRGLRAGAVADVEGVKNPVALARAIMNRGSAVLLVGAGALTTARAAGIELAPPEYFRTERRWRALEEARARAAAGEVCEPRDYSTVGAAARDVHGNVAAATSTGGLTNKPVGRAGDSPIVGAGTYASNRSCAVSATGRGEDIMRATVARDIAALMEYGGKDVRAAVDHVIEERLAAIGGEAGVAVVDRNGRVVFGFNTEMMYRGAVGSDRQAWTAIGRSGELHHS